MCGVALVETYLCLPTFDLSFLGSSLGSANVKSVLGSSEDHLVGRYLRSRSSSFGNTEGALRPVVPASLVALECPQIRSS